MRRLARLAGYGAIMTAGTLSAYRLTVGSGPVSEADTTRGTIVALTAFVFFQLFNLQNARFPDHSALRRHAFTNWRLWAATATVLGLQIGAVSWDRIQVLFTGRDAAVQLGLGDWVVAIAAATPILIVEELRKRLGARNRRA